MGSWWDKCTEGVPRARSVSLYACGQRALVRYSWQDLGAETPGAILDNNNTKICFSGSVNQFLFPLNFLEIPC